MRNHCFHFDSFPWQRSVDDKNKCTFSHVSSLRDEAVLAGFPWQRIVES